MDDWKIVSFWEGRFLGAIYVSFAEGIFPQLIAWLILQESNFSPLKVAGKMIFFHGISSPEGNDYGICFSLGSWLQHLKKHLFKPILWGSCGVSKVFSGSRVDFNDDLINILSGLDFWNSRNDVPMFQDGFTGVSVFVCVCMSFRQLQVSGSECPECFRDFNPRSMLFCIILKPGIERSMMIYAPLWN